MAARKPTLFAVDLQQNPRNPRAAQRSRRGKSKVAEFDDLKRNLVVTQYDLAEECLLKQNAAEARKKLKEKRQLIRRLLEAGASVEPGLRRAALPIRRALIIR